MTKPVQNQAGNGIVDLAAELIGVNTLLFVGIVLEQAGHDMVIVDGGHGIDIRHVPFHDLVGQGPGDLLGIDVLVKPHPPASPASCSRYKDH